MLTILKLPNSYTMSTSLDVSNSVDQASCDLLKAIDASAHALQLSYCAVARLLAEHSEQPV
jgi:hypothetical protein